MSVLTGLFKLTTYVRVVGMESDGLSDMLNKGGFGGGLWGNITQIISATSFMI